MNKVIHKASKMMLLVALLAFAGSVAAQVDLEKGIVYYDNGEYEKAVPIFRELAEQGLAAAQKKLGICYYIGQGVTQSYTEAVKWYRKAAEQGNVDAKEALKKIEK